MRVSMGVLPTNRTKNNCSMTDEETVRSEGKRSSNFPNRVGWLGYWLRTYSSRAHWDFSCKLSICATSDRPQASGREWEQMLSTSCSCTYNTQTSISRQSQTPTSRVIMPFRLALEEICITFESLIVVTPFFYFGYIMVKQSAFYWSPSPPKHVHYKA